MVSTAIRSVTQTPERKIQPRIVFGFASNAARTARNVMRLYSFLRGYQKIRIPHNT
jgi:hypothetical protein